MATRLNKGVILISILLIVTTMILAGCGETNENAVAKVNGELILKTEFDQSFEMERQRYITNFGEDIMSKTTDNGVTIEQALKEVVLETLIREEIVLRNAEKDNITVSDEEITSEIETYKELVGGEEGFTQFLNTNNMTEDYFRESIKKQLIMESYKDKYVNTLEITDEDIESEFNANKESYIKVRASHILVEKESEAKEILKQLESGADFAELAIENSIHRSTAENGGDLTYFSRGQLEPGFEEFEEIALSLNINELSDIIKSEYGYHIIKVMDKKDTLEQLKEQVVLQLQNDKFDEKIQQLYDDAKIEILMTEDK